MFVTSLISGRELVSCSNNVMVIPSVWVINSLNIIPSVLWRCRVRWNSRFSHEEGLMACCEYVKSKDDTDSGLGSDGNWTIYWAPHTLDLLQTLGDVGWIQKEYSQNQQRASLTSAAPTISYFTQIACVTWHRHLVSKCHEMALMITM